MRRLVFIAFAVAVAVSAPAALAAGTLDQSQTGYNAGLAFGGNGYGENRPAAQTFTAGLTGRLDQIDAYIRLNEPLMESESCSGGPGVDAAIRTVGAGGTPGDVTLASGSVAVDQVPTEFGWVSVEISPPAAVTEGTQYALVLSTQGGCSEIGFPYEWGAGGGNPYAGGRSYGHLGSNWVEGGAEFDQDFKTYVDTTAESPPPTSTTTTAEQTSTPQQTPSPEASPPAAPTSFQRTLSISYSPKKHAFRGRLASKSPPCVSGQRILIFKKKRGRDPKIGSTATYASGKYSIKVRNAAGRFYAKTGTGSAAGATCLPAATRTIKVG